MFSNMALGIVGLAMAYVIYCLARDSDHKIKHVDDLNG